jgi:hypothetical protein
VRSLGLGPRGAYSTSLLAARQPSLAQAPVVKPRLLRPARAPVRPQPVLPCQLPQLCLRPLLHLTRLRLQQSAVLHTAPLRLPAQEHACQAKHVPVGVCIVWQVCRRFLEQPRRFAAMHQACSLYFCQLGLQEQLRCLLGIRVSHSGRIRGNGHGCRGLRCALGGCLQLSTPRSAEAVVQQQRFSSTANSVCHCMLQGACLGRRSCRLGRKHI